MPGKEEKCASRFRMDTGSCKNLSLKTGEKTYGKVFDKKDH